MRVLTRLSNVSASSAVASLVVDQLALRTFFFAEGLAFFAP